ncbi:MAG: hypothetical protein CM15mV5_1310 [uncultured marine virus]|nr:MAG: hypothetical protein CM15mV5_1310 [uncultured marine virus]
MKTHPVPLKVVPYIFMVAVLASTSTSIFV